MQYQLNDPKTKKIINEIIEKAKSEFSTWVILPEENRNKKKINESSTQVIFPEENQIKNKILSDVTTAKILLDLPRTKIPQMKSIILSIKINNSNCI